MMLLRVLFQIEIDKILLIKIRIPEMLGKSQWLIDSLLQLMLSMIVISSQSEIKRELLLLQKTALALLIIAI